MQAITQHREKSSQPVPVVVDPVLVSTSGSSLSGDDAVEAMTSALVPVATVLTPNLDEASALLGVCPLPPAIHCCTVYSPGGSDLKLFEPIPGKCRTYVTCTTVSVVQVKNSHQCVWCRWAHDRNTAGHA